MNSPHLVIGLAMLALSARADDWPQWRGPQRDNVWREKGVMKSFPADGLEVLWRADAGGGWSSPVVVDGRVFLIDSELKSPKARERVRCFEAASGKLLWMHAYDIDYPDWAFGADQMGGPTSTSAVADGKVYSLGANGLVTCLAITSGELIWSKDLEKEYEAKSFSLRASPLIDRDLVILVVGGKPEACFVALDRRNGREVWKALEETVVNSSPIIITAGGKRQLIVWTAESVASLDPATGAVWWRHALTTTNSDANATPVCLGDRLLISGLMFQLEADKPGAKILWPENPAPNKRVLSNTSTPWLTNDAVYCATNRGDLVCLDAGTGKELWHTDKVTDRKSGPSIHITPNGDSALLFTNLGELIRARLIPAGYEELSRTKLIEPVYSFGGRKISWSPPSYANRCVFVRNEHEILCASLAAAQDEETPPKTVVAKPGRVLLREDFTRPVDAIVAGNKSKVKDAWRVYSGHWDFADGALRGRQLPDDGRSAFVVFPLHFTAAVIQFDFRMDGCRQVIFRIQDGIPEHICSVRIRPDGFSAQRDDHDHQGPDKAVPFGQAALPIAAGEWKTLLVEIKGDSMAVTMDGRTIRGSDPLLAADKATVEFVVTGETASFRNLRIWEVAPTPDH